MTRKDMGNVAPEWNYCLLMKGGRQLNFQIMFLAPLVNLVNNVPVPLITSVEEFKKDK